MRDCWPQKIVCFVFFTILGYLKERFLSIVSNLLSCWDQSSIVHNPVVIYTDMIKAIIHFCIVCKICLLLLQILRWENVKLRIAIYVHANCLRSILVVIFCYRFKKDKGNIYNVLNGNKNILFDVFSTFYKPCQNTFCVIIKKYS